MSHRDAADRATAPPQESVEVKITCPFCDSERVDPMALFGQKLLTVQFYCNNCHTPFEKIKDERALRSFE
jgi:transcription elongation factor Elf1